MKCREFEFKVDIDHFLFLFMIRPIGEFYSLLSKSPILINYSTFTSAA